MQDKLDEWFAEDLGKGDFTTQAVVSNESCEAKVTGGPGVISGLKICFDLLERHNIDYISMDIESSEHHVLNHWNFDKYNVQLWCLEGNQFANLMKSKGYKLLDTNGYKINDSNTFWGLA